MATRHPLSPFERATESLDDYANCLIKPMGRKGEQLIRWQHVLDAILVAFIVFFAVILGDVVITIPNGGVYLSVADIVQRIPTAIMAFFLTFFAQWGRARGLDVRDWLVEVLQ